MNEERRPAGNEAASQSVSTSVSQPACQEVANTEVQRDAAADAGGDPRAATALCHAEMEPGDLLAEPESGGVLATALDLLAHGCSVVPVRPDGSKTPMGSWKTYQTRRATEQEVREWFSDPAGYDLGMVQGAVSGGAVMIEVEGRAVHLLSKIDALAAAHGPELASLWAAVQKGWAERSPSGGLHMHAYLMDCPVPGNTKVACRPATADELAQKPKDKMKVLVETRGEGGQVVLAPSRHHRSGKGWVRMSGGPATAPRLDRDAYDELLNLLRTLDELASPRTVSASASARAQITSAATDASRPGDAFAVCTSWADILEPYGWQFHHAEGDEIHWTRPGKATSEGTSATTNYKGSDSLYVFSTSTLFDAERSYSKFGAYAMLAHGGDMSAAACALREQGFGEAAPESITRATGRPDAMASGPNVPDPLPTVDGASGTGEVDLTDLVAFALAGTLKVRIPEVGVTADGTGLFYEGCINGVAGESGGGKTWLSMAVGIEQMKAGHHFWYADLEDTPETAVLRMLALGCPAAMLAAGPEQRFHYLQPPMSADAVVDAVGVSGQPGLVPYVVLDSTGEALSLARANPNADEEVARWFRAFPRPLAQRCGATVVLLDHMTKAEDGGLWPIGSHRKRAAVTGAQYVLEVCDPFSKDKDGSVALKVAKDRHGAREAKSVASYVRFTHPVETTEETDGGSKVLVVTRLDRLSITFGAGKTQADAAADKQAKAAAKVAQDVALLQGNDPPVKRSVRAVEAALRDATGSCSRNRAMAARDALVAADDGR